MAKKQMCDVTPATGISRGQSTEHLRNYKVIDPEAKKYGYYDPTRMNLNFEVGRGGKIIPVNKQYSLDKRLKDNLRRRGIKMPQPIYKADGTIKERRVIANMALGGNRQRMRELAFGDQQVDFKIGADNRGIERKEDIERWAVEMYDFVAKKYGEDNIIAFVVHLDEKNPHVHCTIVPVNEKNKISYNQMFGGSKEKARMKSLHDEVAKINRKWGLERGDSVAETGAKHRTSEEYWDWLSSQCTELEKKKGGLEQDNSALQKQNDFLNHEMNKANIRVKGLMRMVDNLKIRKESIEEEISTLREELKKGQNTSDDMLLKRERLEGELEDIEKQLKDKLEKLRVAEEKLDQIALKRIELEKVNDELESSIYHKKSVLTDVVLRSVKSEIYDIVGEQMATRREMVESFANSLEGDGRIKFDNLMEDLATSTKELQSFINFPNEVAAISGALFLGYIDQATSIAQAHGGGGGPGGGWGRKEYDDDDLWMRKCCYMAARMMRPGPKLAPKVAPKKGPRR
ncbi:MAG: plasmid recombination protein [Prevotella sp.]|nr:plasmid recombination protein [Prevotella sp.]